MPQGGARRRRAHARGVACARCSTSRSRWATTRCSSARASGSSSRMGSRDTPRVCCATPMSRSSRPRSWTRPGGTVRRRHAQPCRAAPRDRELSPACARARRVPRALPTYRRLRPIGDDRDRGARALGASGTGLVGTGRLLGDRRGDGPDRADRRGGYCTRPARRPRAVRGAAAGRAAVGGGEPLGPSAERSRAGVDRRIGARRDASRSGAPDPRSERDRSRGEP